MKQERIEAFARLGVVMVALINSLLTASGQSVLPWSGEFVGEVISNCLTVAAIIYAAWWRNNNISVSAGQAQQVLDSLKKDEITAADVQGMLFSDGNPAPTE